MMCDSRQPLAGADSKPPLPYWERPGPIQCGTWIERADCEGFCSLAPDHEGGCEPPPYEVND